MIWRCFAAGYNTAWLVYDVTVQSSDIGVKWFIYFTNLSYVLLVVTFIVLAITSLDYTFLYCCKKSLIKSHLPDFSPECPDVYDQDNINWIVKVTWFLYINSISLAFLSAGGYYFFSDPEINAISLHFHGINVIFALADLLLSRMPLQILHFPWNLPVPCGYIVFTAIYYALGQTDPYGKYYIYPALDYGSKSGTSTGYAILFIIVPSVVYACLWVMVRLRDLIHNHNDYCHQDLKYDQQHI